MSDTKRPTSADEREDWMDEGICNQTDPEAFYPEKGSSTREAKQVCNACPVRIQCLRYALEHNERFGVWGGLSERERRKIRSSGTRTPAEIALLIESTENTAA